MGNGFSFASIPDLSGRGYVITGANTGIGLVTATQIAKRNGNVYLVCRSREKAQLAIEAIRCELSPEQRDSVKLEYVLCDLASLKSCVAAARELIAARKFEFDVLIANAGIMMCPFSTTEDGIETQFGVNHLGHFVFVGLLMPHFRKNVVKPRLVVVSSVAHNFAPKTGVMPRDKLALPPLSDNSSDNGKAARDEMAKGYGPIVAYGNSKLCNVLYARRLARVMTKADAPHVLVLHPGYVDTELGRHIKDSYGGIVNGFRHVSDALFAKSPANGALTSLFAAVDDKALALASGTYLVPTAKASKPSAQALDEGQQDSLHRMSLDIVRERLGGDIAGELENNYSINA